MRGMVDYIRFLLKSTNEHGVHSPFLFLFITKGVYARNPIWDGKKKTSVFIERALTYFQPNNIMTPSMKEDKFTFFSNAVFVTWNSMDLDKVDMFFIDEISDLEINELVSCLGKMKNDSFVVIDKRARLDSTIALWNKVVESNDVTLSVDFYFFGIAFVRKEQLKEHFFIRL